MTTCPVCGTLNAEAVAVCSRCGATVNPSPTMSISSEMPEANLSPRTPPPSSSQRGFAPGTVIANRYRVVSLLGRGGMGEVYAADDLKLGQRVALKFLPADRLKSASWREQFYAEVRLARQVSHPNVCRVYDVGESDDLLFLSMEFVDGEDLASLLRRIGRLPDDKAIEVAQQLCAGLAAAHRNGVLHRDLKPANVMLDGKGFARITDFGLAIASSQADQTRPGGTPGYVAPEVFNGTAPSVQSDLYALGLVLYELFTGKKAFEAANLAEFHRKQSETNPAPPSSVIKNFDPTVERMILRCLDRDPSQRPHSAMSIAAGLPGGDPLEAALAAGETPAPEIVAAFGPEGAMRPITAWSCLIGAAVLILGSSIWLAPHFMDWGLTSMNKSPEVLADHARELAKTLGYPVTVDDAYWMSWSENYNDYLREHPIQDWRHAWAGHAWPSAVAFWYRKSPESIMPLRIAFPPLSVTQSDPSNETSGMLTVNLDTDGHLLFLRGVPLQVESGDTGHEPDWNLLFNAAGLDKARFTSAPPKWLPPEVFDKRADWEGHLTDQPDLPLHVAAAAYRGTPVYFQVIAPWDKPWRKARDQSKTTSEIVVGIVVIFIAAYLIVGGFFARKNIQRGRGDTKGAIRVAWAVALSTALSLLSGYHFVLNGFYLFQIISYLTISLVPAFFVWIGYMAIEPYARRTWPKLLVSTQRLLNGKYRDPLMGRDILLGGLAGAALYVNDLVLTAWGANNPDNVTPGYGMGLVPAIGDDLRSLSVSFTFAFLFIGILTIATAILRRKWLALAIAALLTSISVSHNGWDVLHWVLGGTILWFILIRIGLIGMISAYFIDNVMIAAPPLDFTKWYGYLSLSASLVALTLLVWGFYASLGGQPLFGQALKDD